MNLEVDSKDEVMEQEQDRHYSRLNNSHWGKTAQFELPQKPMKLDKTE